MSKSPSPLRYPGGKTALLDLVAAIIRQNSLDRGHYVEPFAGGSGLALSLLFRGDVAEIHLNDLDPAISAFWRSVIFNTNDFIELVNETSVTVDERAHQRKIYLSRGVDDLHLGFATFFLNRVNRSGIIKTGGAIGGLGQLGAYKIDCRFNKPELIERIRRISKYQSRIHFSSLDANDFVREVQAVVPGRTFMYADPPYFMKGAELYTSSFGFDDHRRFWDTLCETSLNWILTYDNAKEMRQLYSNFRTFDLSVGYSVQVKRTGEEILVASENTVVSAEDIEHWASGRRKSKRLYSSEPILTWPVPTL